MSLQISKEKVPKKEQENYKKAILYAESGQFGDALAQLEKGESKILDINAEIERKLKELHTQKNEHLSSFSSLSDHQLHALLPPSLSFPESSPSSLSTSLHSLPSQPQSSPFLGLLDDEKSLNTEMQLDTSSSSSSSLSRGQAPESSVMNREQWAREGPGAFGWKPNEGRIDVLLWYSLVGVVIVRAALARGHCVVGGRQSTPSSDPDWNRQGW